MEYVTCIICSREVGANTALTTREGDVCMGCSHRVYTCSRCRERTIHASVFSHGTPEVICGECLARRAAGEEFLPPYWEKEDVKWD